MLKVQHFRAVLVTLGTCLFFYQTYIAIELYIDGQYAFVSTEHSLETVDQPIILVCDGNVFNRNNSYGYTELFQFIMGHRNNRTKIGWEMSEKDSIRNMMKEIFSTNGNNVEVISRSKSQKLNHSADTVFIIPRGVCLKFELNFSLGHTEIDIFLKKASNYNIMLVYPDMLFNGFLIHNGGTNNAQISIYSSDFNEYEAFQIYHVNMIGKTNSPSVNGCTKNCSKFKNCLDSHVKKTFISHFGCLPPWIEDSELTCKKSPSNITVQDSGRDLIWELIKQNVVSKCMKCCTQMGSSANLFQSFHGRKDQVALKFLFQESVLKSVETRTYAELNLIVDAGSALGLWIGTSVVGIFDILVLAYKIVEEKTTARVPLRFN